ncbi:hypothetical protein [Parenemella sanctibonifatiensis]|uniref:hypothetical protein n=1 Tax=Parenemella sanctibonifatiensis TaxID=2016505 RepID=UPI0015C68598|nr:hypothetical protein [Parenemella sanctibonifatiensis]
MVAYAEVAAGRPGAVRRAPRDLHNYSLVGLRRRSGRFHLHNYSIVSLRTPKRRRAAPPHRDLRARVGSGVRPLSSAA